MDINTNTADFQLDYEYIQQAYNDQQFIFNEIKTSIDCIKEHCENTPEKAYILHELTTALEGVYDVLILRRAALERADQEYIRRQQAVFVTDRNTP